MYILWCHPISSIWHATVAVWPLSELLYPCYFTYLLYFTSAPGARQDLGTGPFRSHALSFPGTKRPHSGRFVPGNESVDVSFPGTKLPSNIRSHELSSPTTVALLGMGGE